MPLYLVELKVKTALDAIRDGKYCVKAEDIYGAGYYFDVVAKILHEIIDRPKEQSNG